MGGDLTKLNTIARIPRQRVLMFTIFAVAVGAMAYREYAIQGETIENETRRRLVAVADMNARQVLEWRHEREGDARSLMADRTKLDLLRRVITGSATPRNRSDLHVWLQAVSRYLRYAYVAVTDVKGNVLESAGTAVDDNQRLRRMAMEAVGEGSLIYRDVAITGTAGQAYQYLGVALRDDSRSPVFGTVLLVIDPQTYEIPVLEGWVGPSKTAESLLIRRDDHDAVILNSPRNRSDSPVGLRVPLTRSENTVVKAVLGAEGPIEGKDYRGKQVIAAARSVPGTGWVVIAKIDRDEVLGVMWRHAILLAVAGLSLIAAGGAMLLGEWRRQQARFYQAELEKQALRGHFDYLSRYANDSIFLLDGTGRIVETNDCAISTYGYSVEEFRNMTVEDLRRADQVVEFAERWKEVQARGSLIFESLHVRRDGSVFPVEVSTRVFEVDGNPFMQSIHRDLTERKAAERERAQLEARLQQAHKMETIGRLAGGIAHDFNNYLTVINGYCDLLLRQFEGNPAARRRLEEIRAAGRSAAELSGQLLTFSRKQLITPRRISLNTLVTQSIDLLARIIAENVAIVTHLDPLTQSVMADAGQMKQVLLNLAVNARDAMPHGGTVEIATTNAHIGADYLALHPEAKAGDYAVLSLTDDGSGISPEKIEHIFDPFFTTKSNAGTGLGLATVYGIVRQAGGWIEVESELDKGSTFRIYLPADPGPPDTTAESDPQQTSLSGSETILVVEDHEEIRILMRSILEENGYRLLEAADGSKALELAGHHPEPIHLLLSDVVMPGMSGPELGRRLRETRPDMRVLYVSGYPSDNMARQPLIDPGTPYLQKPFSPVALAAKVREVLDSGKSKRRVLVADDDAGVRSYLRETLEEAGYAVSEVPDAAECLRELGACPADLVITDMVMPGMEGLELIRQIGREHPSIPVVLMSGASHQGLIRAAMHLGGRAVLEKPIAAEPLLRVVSEVLSA